MLEWWNNMDLLQQIYALIAIPSTLVLIVQTVVQLAGAGDDIPDGDADISDGVSDGMSVFTLRGIIAMLCIGGWSGLVMLESGMKPLAAILLSVLFGTAALLLIGFIMYFVSKLQSNGNIVMSAAVGKSGTVYIPIPPRSRGKGKITLTLQDSFIEADAVTTAQRKIATGETVRIVATDETGTLVVEPVTAEGVD